MANQSPKRVTLQDIAIRAGVTKTTVSYALNGTGSVSPSLIQKIQEIAEELEYRPNQLALATRTGRTKTIGLMLPDLTNPFFPVLAQAVQSAARQQGYSVFLFDCHNSSIEEGQGLEQLSDHAIAGLIWCPTEDKIALEKAQNLPFPAVVIDRPIEGYDSVYANSYKGGQLQGEFVLANHHQRVGVLSGPERSPSALARKKGLYSVIDGKCSVCWDLSLEYDINSLASEHAAQILDNLPTCVVAANDVLAIGLYRLLHQHGLKVPEDVSVIGFDNIDWATLVTPPLTTIELPIADIGQQAFSVLMQRLQKPQAELVDQILDVQLIERASFRPV